MRVNKMNMFISKCHGQNIWLLTHQSIKLLQNKSQNIL